MTINVVASGGDYEGFRASFTFVVIDDEPRSTTITLSLLDENMEKLEQLEVQEGGGPVRVYVAAETTTTLYADVPIYILIYGGRSDYSLTPVGASLHIPAGEKRGMAEFLLTPIDDGIDEDDETFYLYGHPSGKAANLIASIATASFRIIDDDSRAVIVTPTALKVPEGGGRRTYSVRLGSQPEGGDVSVRITDVSRDTDQMDQEDRTLRFFEDTTGQLMLGLSSESNGDLSSLGAGIVLTFTAANWFEERLVYVELLSNDIMQDDSVATVNHSVSGGGYNGETVPDVALTLTEFGFVLTEPMVTIVSEGGSFSYDIRLISLPADTVMMRVILPPNAGISLSLTISELIFSTENWDQAQVVTVEYVDDDLSSGNRTLEIAHIAVSNASEYDSEGGTVAVVKLTFKDDEEFPRLRLLLSPSNAVEGDGGSDGSQRTQTIDIRVTAELDGPARTEETIVFLSLGPNAAAAGPGGYTPTLAADAFLVIPPRAARSTGGAQHSRVTVTLTLIRDFIDEEDETFAIIGRADGLYDGSATFTIIDDDVRGLEIGEIAEVTEGGAISYTLALRSRPTGTVTVEFRTTGSAEVAISQSLLVFSTTNWHIPQEITVSAIENNIAEGPPRDVTITYVVSGGDYADFPLVASTVTILDNDVASTRVDLSLNPSSAEEGRVIGITVTAVLNALPRSQLTAVQLSVRQNLGADEGADFTLDFSNGMTIEIPSGEISASIVVSLELIDDDIYDRGEKFAILGSVVGGGLAGGSAMFTIIDNDRYGIEVSPTTLDVTEGGAGREYSVALLSQPTAPVTVELDVMVAEGVGVRLSDISLNGQPPFSPLLFDPEDWATPQIVTVEVAENNHIQQRPTVVTITHTVLGGDYAGFKLSPTTVNIADDEPDKTDVTLSLLDESQRNLEELEEGDGPATVYVAAEISPTLYVDVPIALTYDGGTADADDYTLTPVGAPLLIRAGETRGTAMFRLTLNDDRIDEENETVEIVGAASGDAANFIASITPVSFSILDDDTRGVIIEASALTVSENKGGSITFSVRLRSEPYGDGGDESVQVGIMNIERAPEDMDEGRRLRFSDGSTLMTSLHNGTVVGNLVLTFTKDDWDEPQTVNVELSDDDDRLQEDSVATILHSVSGADYDTVTVPPVVLTLKQFGFFVTDPTPADVSEGGTASYDIRLTSRPENTVRVRVILPPNPSIDLSRSSGVLTFTTGNWNVPQPVIVEYVNDDVSTGNQTLEITHTAESNDANYNGAPVAAVSLNFTDDVGDLPRLTLRLSPSFAGEGNGGSERMIPVMVTAAFIGFPRSTETIVSLSLGLDGDTADVDDYSTDLSPAAFLVIPAGETISTYGTLHSSIVLTLVQDDIDESDESFTLTAVDNAAVLAGTSTVFTILDDDTRRVIVTPEALTVPEGGGRRNYTVRLASQPVGGDVTVKITGVARADEDEEQGRTLSFFQDSAGDAKITSADDLLFAPVGEGVVLTFTAANWFEEQAVYVELASNDVVQDDSEATIEHSVSGGDYADETVPDVVLKLTEFGFFVSAPTPATVSEGESAEYSIRLTSEPEDTVMVTVVLPSNPSIDFSLTTPEVLSFSTENWHETQPVIVEYEDDEWSNGDHILEITHTAESEDANYDSGGVSELPVRLNFRDDEDLPELRLVLSQDRAVEGTGMSEESPLEMTVTAGFVGSPRSDGDDCISVLRP